MQAVVPLLMIVSMTLGPVLVWKVASWIARPLDLAAKHRQHATQFTIVDFLCLFVLNWGVVLAANLFVLGAPWIVIVLFAFSIAVLINLLTLLYLAGRDLDHLP